MRKRPFKLPIKLIIVTITVFLALCLIARYLGRIFKSSGYFKIKDIMMSEDSMGGLSYLKGRNIFTIDLRRQAQYILKSYPSYRNIRLVRILPNRLFVDFRRRKPLALIKLYRKFFVDEDLILLDVADEKEGMDLPLILGLETKIYGPKSGTKYNLKELIIALNIIKETKRNKILKDYNIKRVDVGNPGNTTFFIVTGASPDLEIRIGQEDISDKINILADLITQMKDDLGNIKYIDLRFKESVIKLNEVK